MAYSKERQIEHPSKTIIKTINQGLENDILPRLVLLCGKEDFLIDWSKSFLKNSLVNPATMPLDFADFSEDNMDLGLIIQSASTFPIASKRKLVFVEEIDALTSSSKEISQNDLNLLTSFFSEIPETTMLVFICKKPNKTKALYKAIEKQGIIYNFTSLDDGMLLSWMQKRLKNANKTCDSKELLEFAKTLGYGDSDREYTLYNLENDLKIIFSYFDKENLTLFDMLSLVSAQGEINSFKLLDAAFSGDKNKALTILHNSISNVMPSKEIGVLLSFLGLLISQLEIMVEGTERKEEGQSSSQIQSEMGVNEYRLKKALAACQGKKSSILRLALFKAYQIEKDIKLGNIDGRYALELYIANL